MPSKFTAGNNKENNNSNIIIINIIIMAGTIPWETYELGTLISFSCASSHFSTSHHSNPWEKKSSQFSVGETENHKVKDFSKVTHQSGQTQDFN